MGTTSHVRQTNEKSQLGPATPHCHISPGNLSVTHLFIESPFMSSHLLINIIMAKTAEERRAAEEALDRANANAPTDADVISDFLKKCTTLSGAPLALDRKTMKAVILH